MHRDVTLLWIHSQKHFLVEGKSTTTTTKMITLVYVEKKHMDKEVIMGDPLDDQ